MTLVAVSLQDYQAQSHLHLLHQAAALLVVEAAEAAAVAAEGVDGKHLS